MHLGVLSLLFLLIAITLGFWRKMNTGLVAIGLALLVGRLGGISDKEIISGFNSSLFVMLLGVTYLFSMSQVNGTLELFARKAVALAGKRTNLIPVIVYVFSVFLAAVGPGTIPVMALMMPFTMALASEIDVSPLCLAPIGILGATAGGISPIAPTGIIGLTLAQSQGFMGIEIPYFLTSLASQTIWAALLYFIMGCHRIKTARPVSLSTLPGFNREQRITLTGIGALVVVVLTTGVNVGLMAFLVAAVLSFFKVADEREAIANTPWSTLLLITGVGILMQIAIEFGGIKVLADFLARFMTPKTASPIIGLTSGIMSWFSSTSGVVLPTLIPTVRDLMTSVGGVAPLDLIAAITHTSHVAATSPMSTGGALAFAAYVANNRSNEVEQHKLFLQMFLVSAGGVLFVSALAGLGLYRLF